MIEAIKVNPNSLSRELDLPVEQVEATINLLNDGFSVPFILRYRKDQTGLPEEDVVRIATSYEKQRKFTDRKYSYLKTLDERGQLTPELKKLIIDTRAPHRLDDLYLPFKAKTEAVPQAARGKGLDPLAKAIMTAADESASVEELAAPYVSAEKGVATVEDALGGAADIIAESFAEDFALRQSVRGYVIHNAKVVCKRGPVFDEKPAEGAASAENADNTESAENAEAAEQNDGKKKSQEETRLQTLERHYASYFGATFEFRRLTRDQIQTLDRGVNSRSLDVTLELDRAKLLEIAHETLLPEGRAYAAYLTPIVEKALDLYLLPALEQDVRHEAVDDVLEQSLANVGSSLYNKVTRRPVPAIRVLGVDASYRSSCKIAAIDEQGAVLAVDSIVVRGAEAKINESIKKVVDFVEKYNLGVIALRTGVARTKLVEAFFTKLVSENLADKSVVYIEVNDAGLDAYAGSEKAQKELPEQDAAARAAIYTGRRLQNPLREYVKVSPEFLCDDPFCRKLRIKTLRDALAKVVSRAVNCVGVDVNTADADTLGYVVGLTPLSVKNLIEFRETNGPFRTREQFKEVSGVSDSTFAQCAGFMRVVDGDNPLDATWIHPESYPVATAVLEKFGLTVEDLRSAEKRAELGEKTKDANYEELAKEFGVGKLLLADIVSELVTPGQDVREKSDLPIFKKSLIKLSELQPGMALTGVVSRVVDYGAFIDFGGVTAGMVHISRLSATHVRDARQAVSVGDTVKVWVVDVDAERGRVGLTMIEPGSAQERRARRPRQEEANAGSEGERRERRPRRPREEGETAEKGGENRRPRGERGERGSRRSDRGRDVREHVARSVQVAAKKNDLKPLSEEKKSGRESLQSFSELKQFFNL